MSKSIKLPQKCFKFCQNTKLDNFPKHKTNFLLKLKNNQHHSVRKIPWPKQGKARRNLYQLKKKCLWQVALGLYISHRNIIKSKCFFYRLSVIFPVYLFPGALNLELFWCNSFSIIQLIEENYVSFRHQLFWFLYFKWFLEAMN